MGIEAATWAAISAITAVGSAGYAAAEGQDQKRSGKHDQRDATHASKLKREKLEAEKAKQEKNEESRAILDKNRARKKMQGAGATGRASTIKTGTTTGTSTAGGAGGTKNLLGL